ncbi:hypothetical protein LA080_014966 [Diaporthe eres]|nr:hypothetical protein LA080_014966 [Diaporthe eres]
MKTLNTAAYITLAASVASAVRLPLPPRPICVLPCPSDAICISDPKPRCAVPNGFCGGIGGFACEAKNEYCIDDPRDDCDPGYGGFDCGGVCVKKPKDTCT